MLPEVGPVTPVLRSSNFKLCGLCGSGIWTIFMCTQLIMPIMYIRETNTHDNVISNGVVHLSNPNSV